MTVSALNAFHTSDIEIGLVDYGSLISRWDVITNEGKRGDTVVILGCYSVWDALRTDVEDDHTHVFRSRADWGWGSSEVQGDAGTL